MGQREPGGGERALAQCVGEPVTVVREREIPLAAVKAYLLDPISPKRERYVVAKERDYAEIRGWKRDGDVFRGVYRANGSSWPGFAKQVKNGTFEFFLNEIPDSLRSHPCINRRRKCWSVHFHRPRPKSVAAGVAAVEDVLAAYTPHEAPRRNQHAQHSKPVSPERGAEPKKRFRFGPFTFG